MEKKYLEEKDKEKKQLDAEICFDNWVQKVMEQDIIKLQKKQQKQLRRSLTEKMKLEEKEQKKELSAAKVSEWMYYKGFVSESRGESNIFDRLASQSTRNFKKRANNSEADSQNELISDYR